MFDYADFACFTRIGYVSSHTDLVFFGIYLFRIKIGKLCKAAMLTYCTLPMAQLGVEDLLGWSRVGHTQCFSDPSQLL